MMSGEESVARIGDRSSFIKLASQEIIPHNGRRMSLILDEVGFVSGSASSSSVETYVNRHVLSSISLLSDSP